jgi:hypothetical protein
MRNPIRCFQISIYTWAQESTQIWKVGGKSGKQNRLYVPTMSNIYHGWCERITIHKFATLEGKFSTGFRISGVMKPQMSVKERSIPYPLTYH